jgi:hypothetical protein
VITVPYVVDQTRGILQVNHQALADSQAARRLRKAI